MFGIKIHKIPSTKDNDNSNMTTMKSCDSENLVVCIGYHVVNRPTSSSLVSCSLALFSNTIPYFDVISLYLYFSFSHYYYYFVSPKWNIFITNITFIILAWLHTPQHSQLCSLSTTLSPGFLSSSFTIYWVCLSVAPQQPRHQVVLFIFSLFFLLVLWLCVRACVISLQFWLFPFLSIYLHLCLVFILTQIIWTHFFFFFFKKRRIRPSMLCHCHFEW